MLPSYAHEAAESIDASFFSGDCFHTPEALAAIEWYIARWQREAQVLRAAGFYEDDPAPLKARYTAAVERFKVTPPGQ